MFDYFKVQCYVLLWLSIGKYGFKKGIYDLFDCIFPFK